MNTRNTSKHSSHLATIKPYIVVFACLLIGGSSLALLLLSVAIAFTPYRWFSLPLFGGFVLTLKMAFSLAHNIITS